MTKSEDQPTINVIWDRTAVARKNGRVCGVCKCEVLPGEKYDTTGMTVDGAFEIFFRHSGGERYPSGCPTLLARDKAEAEEQYRKDEALWRA